MTTFWGTGRRVVAIVLVALLLVGALSTPARAGAESAAALGLASFLVFTQVFWPLFAPRVVYEPPPYYYPAPPQPAPGPAYGAPAPAPAPAAPTVVYYPHGRYELRGDGVTTAYYWVWIPYPPPPPAPPAPGAPGGPSPGSP